MRYTGKIDRAEDRKIRPDNTTIYRCCHLPIWIWVYFLTPVPLTFSLFAHGFSRWNLIWLLTVLAGVFVAGYFEQLPGCEKHPYILRFNEDRPNPLYRKVCYTFAWNAVFNFAFLNLVGLVVAVLTGKWIMNLLYHWAYLPILAVALVLGLFGKLPRVGPSTKNEGVERRYFYGSVWSVTIAQTVLLILWKALPYDFAHSLAGSLTKLAIYVAVLAAMGYAAWNGKLPRTRPILPGELIRD
jgi:hypothetical protein